MTSCPSNALHFTLPATIPWLHTDHVGLRAATHSTPEVCDNILRVVLGDGTLPAYVKIVGTIDQDCWYEWHVQLGLDRFAVDGVIGQKSFVNSMKDATGPWRKLGVEQMSFGGISATL